MNVRSFFSPEELKALENIGIVLSDDYDYDEEELSNFYDEITDKFPYEYDSNGEPTKMGRMFEHILDVFIDDIKIT